MHGHHGFVSFWDMYNFVDIAVAVFFSSAAFFVFSMSLMMCIALYQDLFPKKKRRKV